MSPVSYLVTFKKSNKSPSLRVLVTFGIPSLPPVYQKIRESKRVPHSSLNLAKESRRKSKRVGSLFLLRRLHDLLNRLVDLLPGELELEAVEVVEGELVF